jgi:hypothetical protein
VVLHRLGICHASLGNEKEAPKIKEIKRGTLALKLATVLELEGYISSRLGKGGGGGINIEI